LRGAVIASTGCNRQRNEQVMQRLVNKALPSNQIFRQRAMSGVIAPEFCQPLWS
jgi:hypothetical protein